MSSFVGTTNNDTFTGTSGDDTFSGLAGNDFFIGGDGNDRAYFAGQANGYRFTLQNGNLQVTDIDFSDGDTGTDTLQGIEQLQFIDQSLTVKQSGVGEFRVNTFTGANQIIPTIATLHDGGWISVWMSNLQDGSDYGVYAQRYDSSGVTVGGEFRVNTTTYDLQGRSDVTALSDGGWLITWESNLQDGSSYGVYAQRYDALGHSVGSEFRVNTTTVGFQGIPCICTLKDGGWLIAWHADGDGDGMGIYAQRFSASGSVVGSEFLVNTTTANRQWESDICALNDGGWVIAWKSCDPSAASGDVLIQRYNANGVRVGGETRAGTYSVSDDNSWPDAPTVTALKDGGWIVTWSHTDADGAGVYFQRYSSSGNLTGSEVRANTTTANDQFLSDATALADGGWLVVWHSNLQDGSDSGVYGQRFDSNGHSVGTEFRINSTTADHQSLPAVSALDDGGWIAVWNSNQQDGSGYGIYSQRYNASGMPVQTSFELTDANGKEITLSADNTSAMFGSSHNDTLNCGSVLGTIVDAGEGIDVTIYSGARSGYQVTKTTSGYQVSNGNHSDNLINVERIQFSNETLALDIDGHAGQAYRVYKAAFDRTPDNAGLKYWIGIMDGGYSLDTVASGFIASQEFQALYGSNPSNQQFVSKLYNNVLHRGPDQGGYDYWVGLLDRGQISKVSALLQFSESAENQAAVIGIIQNGIELF